MTKKVKLKISSRLLKKRNRRNASSRPKQCRFCAGPEQAHLIDYKNVHVLKAFLTERGKILSSRISGNCAFHQRDLAGAVKLSRTMALLPYCQPHFN